MVALFGRAALLFVLCFPSASALAVTKASPRPIPAARPTKGVVPARVVRKPVAKKAPRNPAIELYHVNSRETFRLRFADDRGRPIKGWQKRFQHFMRCHHTNTEHRMDPRLPRLLYQVGRNYAGKRLEIVAGYRNPRVARNPRSPHKKGLACDFRVPGVANASLRDYLRKAFQHVGVGYYPNSSFVHLDVRTGKSAFWIDYSGPGQESEYSRNAHDDLKTGRADLRPAKARNADQDEGLDDLMDAVAGPSGPPVQRTAGESNGESNNDK